jgi:hypothetical protein
MKRHQEKQDLFYVLLLTGSDNDSDYSYIGFIRGTIYLHGGKKSAVKDTSISNKAFAWFFNKLQTEELPECVEVHHSGNCGRCGRTLTTPESLRIGLGPVCAG